MQLVIITPEKIIYDGEVEEILVNTADGEIGILPHHMDLFTKIMPGELVLKVNKKSQFLGIAGGFLEVNSNKVTILADYAVRAEDIEVEKAVEAKKRAEEALKKKKEGMSERDFAAAQADFRKAIMELKVADKRRHRRS